jgi:ribosomal protein S18 acetylase RimI-like enzyme
VDFLILKGYPPEQSLRVAEILYEAFSDSYLPIFHSKAHTIKLLQKHIRQDLTLTAIEDGVVIGVAGLAFKGRNFFNPTLLQVINVLGLDVIHYITKGSPLNFELSADEVNIDSLAVRSDTRSRGVGTLLVSWICDHYKKNGYTKTSLHVIDKNIDARRFYERLGFKTVSEQHLPWPWSSIYGFKINYYMVKLL